jgi:hypothetical protein
MRPTRSDAKCLVGTAGCMSSGSTLSTLPVAACLGGGGVLG